jgi:hypothetical protein
VLRAGNISGQNAAIFTQNAPLFNTTAGLSGRLTVLYGAVSKGAQEPSSDGVSSLSIGNLSLPSRGGWRFCLGEQDCSPYIPQAIWGLYTLLPGEGSYSIIVDGPERGFLGPTQDNNTFEVSADGSFFDVAYFIWTGHPRTPPPSASPTEAFSESAVPISGPMVESALPPSGPIVESALPISGPMVESALPISGSMVESGVPPGSSPMVESALPISNPMVESALPASGPMVESRTHPQSVALEDSLPLSTVAFTLPANVYRIRRRVRIMYLFSTLFVSG